MYTVITFSVFGEQTVTEVEGKSMSAVAKKFKYCIVEKDGKYDRYYRGKKITAKPSESKIWRNGKQAFLVTLNIETKKFQEVHFDNRFMKKEKKHIEDAPQKEYKKLMSMSAAYAEYEKPLSPTTASIDERKGSPNGLMSKKISKESAVTVTPEDLVIHINTDKNFGKDSAKSTVNGTWSSGMIDYPSKSKKLTIEIMEEYKKFSSAINPDMLNSMKYVFLKGEAIHDTVEKRREKTNKQTTKVVSQK